MSTGVCATELASLEATGGPDLSLVEVSEASTIVQEAAHEDANIIFGAVVDPALKGKVKITVIATGFGSDASARTSPSTGAQTPIDMTPYTDHRRAGMPTPSAPLPDPLASPRLSITRRPLLDLPLAGVSLPPLASPVPSGQGAMPEGTARLIDAGADLELGTSFDVPAFLRRQET